MKIDNCCALVTGASAGIGHEFARQLAKRARALVLVARREERLRELRDELAKTNPQLAVHIRKTDLANPAEIDALVAWLEGEKIDVDLLINNAGVGDQGSFATIDPVRLNQILHVNMTALAALTRKLLPGMISRKRGAILNVSSSAGFFPMAGFATYAATKAFVTSFSEALRTEVRGNGINVCTLCPGPVQTEFLDVARRPGRSYMTGPALIYVPVQIVVRDALSAVENNRPIVIPGFLMKLGMLIIRLTPMSILRLVSRATAKRLR